MRNVTSGPLLRIERTGRSVGGKDRKRGGVCSVRSTWREYLQRPQIVVRDANHELRLGEFDRWAEAPQVAVVPWLARDVDRQLANAVVVAFPSVGHADAPYRVRGTISEWDTDASGAAVLVVQWECVTNNEAVLVPLRTSRYTAQATEAGNYGDIVRALNQTLADFAAEVVTSLSSALPAKAA